MLVSDGEAGIKNTCQLSAVQAMKLMGPLRALIDTEINNGPFHLTVKHLSLCEENCHCGIYSDVATNLQLKEELFKKAESFPRKLLIICANQTSQWLCKDALLDELKSQLPLYKADAK